MIGASAASANHVIRFWELITCCVVESTLQVGFWRVLLGLLSNQSLVAALLLTSVGKHSLSVSSLSGIKDC